ncbi:MAG: pilus assembly protein N-terminal domain-containing protein, partial [Planctomycetaceae bacterium]|nr:pilus assembly protein N-terminal domain-containing protein [Planctomycetaceae bacterium]
MPNQTQPLRRAIVQWTIAAVVFASVLPAGAQGPPAPRLPRSTAPVVEGVRPGESIRQIVAPHTSLTLVDLESQVVELPLRIKVVDGHNPDIVTITAISGHQLRIRAESPGVTSVKLIDEEDGVRTLEILVEQDTRELEAYLTKLFPGSAIEVFGFRDAVVLRGWVTDPTHIPRIIEVAESFVAKVHNQLEVAGTSQVQLHVKVMEVQRSKLRELGFNFVIGGDNYFVGNSIGGLAALAGPTALSPGTVPAPSVATSALSASEMLFGLTGNTTTFQGFVKALQSEALAKVL